MSQILRWTWGILLVLTLVTRLAALDMVPLAPEEALEAVAALDAARGDGWPVSTDSPFLLIGNALLFLLFGPGDGIARLLPALAGSALVLLPFFWRKHLGEVGAVVTSGLLLFSPLLLFASRRAESATVGTLGAVLLTTALSHIGSNAADRRRTVMAMILGVTGLSLGLTGGAVFYDALLGSVIAWSVYRWLYTTSQPERIPAANIPLCKRTLAIGIGGALLLSAGLGFRWGGWLNIGDGLANWLAQWRAQPAGGQTELLVLYEPLLICLAIPHVWRALRRTEPLPLALTVSALTTLLLITLRSGAPVSSLVAAILPLAYLAGWTISRIVRTSKDGTGSPAKSSADTLFPSALQGIGVWLHTGAVFILWAHAGLAMARYSLAGTNQGLEIVLIVLTVLIQGLLVMGMIPLFDMPTAWQGLLRGSILTLLLLQASFAWGLAFVHPADPVELAVQTGTSPDLHNLRHVMDALALREGWRRDSLDLALVKGDRTFTAVLRWTLRDYPRLRVLEHWPENIKGFVITPVQDEIPLPETEANWHGMTAVAITRARDTRVTCATENKFSLCPSAMKWYLYRRGNIPPEKEYVRLWVLP